MDTRTTRARHPHNVTLKEMVQSYLYHVENTLAPRTHESYATSLALFVAFCGDVPAEDVTDLHVVRWMKSRLDEGKAPNTVRSDYRRLRYGFFSWAVERGHVGRNWAALAKPPSEPDEPGRSITDRELGRLLLATSGSRTEYRDRALLLLLWDTGMRIGELSQLALADVDLGESVVHVRAEITKTNHERWVPFRAECRAAMHDYLAFERGMEPGPLFLSSRNGKAFHEQTAKHIVREIGIRAGVKVGAHDFRRALVERLQREGMPDTLVMRITGHRSVAMVVRYGKRVANDNAILAYRRVMGR